MKIFKNHSRYSFSFVLGNYCQTGYAFFHKDKAQEIFDDYDVPADQQADIMGAFSDEEIPAVTHDMDYRSKLVYINVGRLSDLRILVADPDSAVRERVAQLNIKELLDILVHDEAPEVRERVAQHNHRDLLDILVADEDADVRARVACHGYPDHIDILVNDICDYVRLRTVPVCAGYYLEILAEDCDLDVREAAAERIERRNALD